MKPVIIIAIIIPIVIGIIAVLVITSMQEQNIGSITEEEQRDEVIWQTLQKTYLMQECREKFMGQDDEMEGCFEQIDEEQRLNPPTSLPIKLSAERLSQVLRLCENTDAQYLGALSFENSTHHIDSQTCTWGLLDEN